MEKVIIIGCSVGTKHLAIEKALIAQNKEPIFICSVDEISENVNIEIMNADAIKLKQLAEIPKCSIEVFGKPKRKGHERPYKFHP